MGEFAGFGFLVVLRRRENVEDESFSKVFGGCFFFLVGFA